MARVEFGGAVVGFGAAWKQAHARLELAGAKRGVGLAMERLRAVVLAGLALTLPVAG